MSSFKPEVHKYVEQIIFEYLRSFTYSKEIEDRYRSLTSQVKSASTNELHNIARKCGSYILENMSTLDELVNLENDDLILEALTQALEHDD